METPQKTRSQEQIEALRYAIGIDIGGTKVLSGLISSDFSEGDELEKPLREPTPQNATAFLDTLSRMCRTLAEADDRTVSAIGISTAGIVDSSTGTVLGSTANIPFLMEIPNLRDLLKERTGLPVYMENDANAACYGEARIGAGRGHDPVLMITLGTGVGGGFVENGRIYSGARFSAMEIGHICIDKDGERYCTCGRLGCWEAYASGTGLEKTTRKVLREHPDADSSTLLRMGKEIELIDNHDLIPAWQSGDAIAKYIMELWHQDIATGLGSIINVLDPRVVVVGGGLCKFVNFEKLSVLTHKRSMLAGTPIRKAVLGNNAGMVGAACLALEHL